jgi:hypothetical protein
MTDKTLPPAFAELTPHVALWALATERERYYRLHTGTLAELRVFYDAMLPRIGEILDYLNQYSLSALPDHARTLFDLAMTFSETAHPIDLKWDDVDFNLAYAWEKFEFRSVSCVSFVSAAG